MRDVLCFVLIAIVLRGLYLRYRDIYVYICLSLGRRRSRALYLKQDRLAGFVEQSRPNLTLASKHVYVE
jgi:hypothetical protein